MDRNCGFLKVDMDLIEDLLHVPPGHRIVDIKWGFANRQGRYIEFYIEGPTLPLVPPGQRLPWVTLEVPDTGGHGTFRW